MDRLIILFPSKKDEWNVLAAFEDEYAVVQEMPFFDAVLFDFDAATKEGVLKLSRQPNCQKTLALYRGPRLPIFQYKNLYNAAKTVGIRMTTDDWCYSLVHRFFFDIGHVIGEKHRDTPETQYVSWEHSSYTDYSCMCRRLAIAPGRSVSVPNSDGWKKIAKDLDADSRFISEFEMPSSDYFNDLRSHHLKEEHHFIHSNLIIQEHVKLKRYGGFTNEWRGRFFDGQLFELLPNSGQPKEVPQPPQWLIDKHKSLSPYYELDFAEIYDGDWLIIGSDDGQVAKRALEQSIEDFYTSLEHIAKESPHLPEWIWCLVANIAEDITYTREDGTTGKGTKHFSPGTKIYIGSSYHGYLGCFRFIVMGKPRHQRRLIQIYIDSNKLCNFRLQKVYDKRVIEQMTRYDRGVLRLGASPKNYGGWDDTHESKKMIEEWVELLNRTDNEQAR